MWSRGSRVFFALCLLLIGLVARGILNGKLGLFEGRRALGACVRVVLRGN